MSRIHNNGLGVVNPDLKVFEHVHEDMFEITCRLVLPLGHLEYACVCVIRSPKTELFVAGENSCLDVKRQILVLMPPSPVLTRPVSYIRTVYCETFYINRPHGSCDVSVYDIGAFSSVATSGRIRKQGEL